MISQTSLKFLLFAFLAVTLVFINELAVAGNGTSKIEGNLQVGRNDWTPEFAGMDGNDLAVEGQFEQAGSGGARFWKIGIGMDLDSDVGTLALSKHVKTPKVASPQDSDLVIDAGLGSRNTLFLHDDVDIHDGDLLVSCSVPGYAMVNNNPAPGTVIA